jgi:hypothetical protein
MERFLMAQAGSLDLGRELAEVKNNNPRLGSLLERVQDAVNRLALNTGTSPLGDIPAPKSPDTVAVKVSGEMMHISVTHTGVLNRNIHYFTEVATNPQFGQSSSVVIHDHGTSRTPTPITLPTFPDATSPQTATKYYVRTIAQMPGGPPSSPTVVGGLGNPTAFTMGGTTQMTLLPCQGSGTGPSNGASLGQGFGKTQKRNA